MKQTFLVIRQLLLSYLATALAYRASFLQSAGASLLWSAFSFISAILVTTQTPSVFGMTRGDLLLLASTYGLVVGTHHWLCSRGFHGFAEIIHKGELDGYLLRPFDTLTFLSLRNIAWSSVPRIIGSFLMTLWVLHAYEFQTSATGVVLFVLLGAWGFLTIYAMHCIAATVLIWHPYLSNIMELIQTSVGVGRYPLRMVPHIPLLAAIVYIPFLMTVNVPTLALIGQLSWDYAVLFIIIGAGLFAFSRWFWWYALHCYTGASS